MDEMQAMIDFAAKLRDLVQQHRGRCHDPACCEPYNMMGFLCHIVGIRADRIGEVKEWLQRYENDCPNCAHLRN